MANSVGPFPSRNFDIKWDQTKHQRFTSIQEAHPGCETGNWNESNRLATVTTFKYDEICFILIARNAKSFKGSGISVMSSATCHWTYVMMSFMFAAVRSQEGVATDQNLPLRGDHHHGYGTKPLELKIKLLGHLVVSKIPLISITNLIAVHLEYRNIDPMLKSYKGCRCIIDTFKL